MPNIHAKSLGHSPATARLTDTRIMHSSPRVLNSVQGPQQTDSFCYRDPPLKASQSCVQSVRVQRVTPPDPVLTCRYETWVAI